MNKEKLKDLLELTVHIIEVLAILRTIIQSKSKDD